LRILCIGIHQVIEIANRFQVVEDLNEEQGFSAIPLTGVVTHASISYRSSWWFVGWNDVICRRMNCLIYARKSDRYRKKFVGLCLLALGDRCLGMAAQFVSEA